MNYNELSEIIKTKKILVKDLCLAIDMTRQGLQFSIDNQTIELRKLKILCETLRISPAQFFEDGTYGIMHNNIPVQQNKQIEALQKENETLKQRLVDKEDIITLLREKRSGYGIVADR